MSPGDLAARLRATFLTELEEGVRAGEASVQALGEPRASAEQVRVLFRVMHTLKGAAAAAGVREIETICHRAEARLVAARDAGRSLSEDERAELTRALGELRAAQLTLERDIRGAGTTAVAVPPSSSPVEGGAPGRDRSSAPATPAIPGDGRASDAWIRVPTARLDALLRTSNQLVMASAAASAATDASRDAAPLVESLRLVDDLAAELSARVRELRLRPVGDAIEGLGTMASEIATASGKRVALAASGVEIEADRGVLVQLREALLHVIRNAVDHGIERPEERAAQGKSDEGTLRVVARVQGDRLVVDVEDDGRGIDLGAVRAALAARGERIPDDDRALVQRLLAGGLSTRREASTVSGRGVGLEAARGALERIGGVVRVTWREGRGTTITLDAPLTLATIRAVLVRAGSALCAFPTASVVRLSRTPTTESLVVEGRLALPTADGPVPLASLAQLLGIPETDGETSDERSGTTFAVLVADAAGRPVALRVSAMLEEDEIVVRPIRAQGGRPARHVSGAALLADGGIALVVDVAAAAADAWQGSPAPSAAPMERQPRRVVLVVDDSITTRTLERSVLEAAGYEVITAVDGADGWRRLQDAQVDLVVADVEMPRMDGLQLCRAIRESRRLQSLPVVLITGLESPDDRLRGLEAGADAYLGKSNFEQAALVDVVRELLGDG